jgi:hypothetical protein
LNIEVLAVVVASYSFSDGLDTFSGQSSGIVGIVWTDASGDGDIATPEPSSFIPMSSALLAFSFAARKRFARRTGWLPLCTLRRFATDEA